MLQTYKNNPKPFLHGVLLIFIIVAPFWFPNFTTQLATLWLFIIVAMTWDMTGGQMGYNSLGNIFFYGTGMYAAAVFAIALVYNVGDYTSAFGGGRFDFTSQQYFLSLIHI